MTDLSMVLWSVLGAVFLELLHWYGLRENPKFPTYARRLKYWAATVGMIAFAGIVTVVIAEVQPEMNKLNAFVLGFSLPAVPHKLGKFLPVPAVAGVTDQAVESLRDFLTSG